MRSWKRLAACALATCIGASAASVAPLRPARADEPSAANVAAARKHFERARDDYGQGAYQEAIGELQAARALDPTAKDLVFNLGVVHEKLADIDDALKWFRLYTTMSLTAQERERADAYIRRLEGAKRELDERQALLPLPPPLPRTAPPIVPPQLPVAGEHTTMGRLDALTVSAAGVAVAGLTFGIVLAALAERDKPPSPFVTGRNGTYSDLVDAQSRAHREAVMADIGFSVAAAAAAAAAVLFFARPRAADTSATSEKGTASVASGPRRLSDALGTIARTTSVSASPALGGGALFVQGSF
jgi:hypothetical protein